MVEPMIAYDFLISTGWMGIQLYRVIPSYTVQAGEFHHDPVIFKPSPCPLELRSGKLAPRIGTSGAWRWSGTSAAKKAVQNGAGMYIIDG